MGSVLRFPSLQVVPIQALEQGDVEQERAQRNWGISYSSLCCFCYRNTHCTGERGKKIALQKTLQQKNNIKLQQCEKAQKYLHSFSLPKYSTVFREHKWSNCESSVVGQGSPGTVKWLAQGDLQHLGRARLASAQRASGFNWATGPLVAGRASRSDTACCFRKKKTKTII